jgi:glyoxylase-like metal-dependent hydrolase (beta-lactamase superfamily II)
MDFAPFLDLVGVDVPARGSKFLARAFAREAGREAAAIRQESSGTRPKPVAMKVHHLNCGTMCPIGRRLVEGRGGLLARARMVCHCLLLEGRDGLVLVDTGLGTDDVLHMENRFARSWRWMAAPRRMLEETALHQVRALGFRPDDVRDIVLTHLDLDHAGGLPDFPHARVHVYLPEHDAAMKRRTRSERSRYILAQWGHNPEWVLHRFRGERWMGFDAVQTVAGEEVVLIPLIGHTVGHCGVAVRRGDRWLLHAGDAFFHHGELETPPRCPLGLRWFQRLMAMMERIRLQNQHRLRELARGGEVDVICSHSAPLFDRYVAEERSEAVSTR